MCKYAETFHAKNGANWESSLLCQIRRFQIMIIPVQKFQWPDWLNEVQLNC